MLYLRQNYQVFCPACGTAVETNEHGERHCPDCDLWYTDQQLFGYQPRHLTPRAADGALLSCWTIESAKDKDVARKVKLYIRENWQELAELLDKYCLLEVERDVSPRR